MGHVRDSGGDAPALRGRRRPPGQLAIDGVEQIDGAPCEVQAHAFDGGTLDGSIRLVDVRPGDGDDRHGKDERENREP